jgi:hypothetical protein
VNDAQEGRAFPHGKRSALESNAKQDRATDQQPGTGETAPICGKGWGEPGMAARSAAAPAALPCQNRNNSNDPTKRYRLTAVPGWVGLKRGAGGQAWSELEDGETILRCDRPSGAAAKSAFHLRQNVASFVGHWGRNHCLFFTLTDEANLHPTQFARRWNSYLVRNGAWIVSFIRVLEPQMTGRPHYHLLVAVPWDTRPDAFDWQAFDGCQQERRTNGRTALFRDLRARYKTSAAPELVSLWSLLRKVLPRYGLGRSELMPLRKGKEAISGYVGKYLAAGLALRRHSWKGCRRVEFDRRAKNTWLVCSRVFSWNSPGAKAWRSRVGQLGAALGVEDLDGIRRKLGRKWAYWMRENITLSSSDDWAELLAVLRYRHVSKG